MSERPQPEPSHAITTLCEHAAGSAEATGSGFSDVLWRHEHGVGPLALGEAWSSIASTLQGLTFAALSPDDQLRVAYSIAEVISAASRRPLVSADADVRFEFQSFVWRVACAWEAFLAGDIEDIAEHARLEAIAASLPVWP